LIRLLCLENLVPVHLSHAANARTPSREKGNKFTSLTDIVRNEGLGKLEIEYSQIYFTIARNK